MSLFEILKHGNFAIAANGISKKYMMTKRLDDEYQSIRKRFFIASSCHLFRYIKSNQLSFKDIDDVATEVITERDIPLAVTFLLRRMFLIDTNLDIITIQDALNSKMYLIEKIVNRELSKNPNPLYLMNFLNTDIGKQILMYYND